ncbi:similar to An04g07800 [Aspergillus luchuensis]|uniref:Similar to An04g07800 n=1 Tax=Aspergillus kawachii TaxID=1069201 RepID=A0A146FLQ8_ASPKA|nr:similar to An04g07800 [Aspergillus luchuensis]
MEWIIQRDSTVSAGRCRERAAPEGPREAMRPRHSTRAQTYSTGDVTGSSPQATLRCTVPHYRRLPPVDAINNGWP